MKATELLKRQHREVEALFGKVAKTEDSRERRELLEQITRKLEMHTRIEEEIFYPAMRELPTKKADAMVNEAYEEHHVVKLVLSELPQVDVEDERFEAKTTVLSELIQHHVEDEEYEMFKSAQKLGKERLEELGAEMQELADESGAGREAA